MRRVLSFAMIVLTTCVAAQNPFDDPTAIAPQGPPAAGVGVAFRDDNGMYVVERVSPNGPAAKAGVKPGDVLIAVDGKDVAAPDFGDPTEHIRGAPGTDVKLVLLRGDEKKEFTIRRVALDRRPSTSRASATAPATSRP